MKDEADRCKMRVMRAWTKKELLAEVHAAGYDLTDRTFTNWVSKGLIANADAEGRGPHGGVGRTWPDSQRRLLLKLLQERSSGVDKLADLAVLPIGIWLYFGDQFVDTKQAMKAMRTWTGEYGRMTGRSAEPAAREYAERIGGPDLDPVIRNRFVKLVMQIAAHPDTFGPNNLKRELKSLEGESPLGLTIHAEATIRLLQARFRATEHIDEFTTADFEVSKASLLSTLAAYQSATDPANPEFDFSTRIKRAPLDVAHHLGLIALGRT